MATLRGVPQAAVTNTRMETPAAAYYAEQGFPLNLPNCPGVNTQGKSVKIRVNQYKVLQWPQRDVYQFDILIGTGAEKRGKIMAVWKSKILQTKIRSLTQNMAWLWDGNKIAWTSYNVSEQRIIIDLDAEKGQQPQQGQAPDQIKVIIRPAKVVRMAVVEAYFNKSMPWDNSILEAINFLDHAIRIWPSDQFTLVKKLFFIRGEQRTALDNIIKAMRNIYTSIYLYNLKSSISDISISFILNINTANSIKIKTKIIETAARLLAPPEVQYSGAKANPDFSGY